MVEQTVGVRTSRSTNRICAATKQAPTDPSFAHLFATRRIVSRFWRAGSQAIRFVHGPPRRRNGHVAEPSNIQLTTGSETPASVARLLRVTVIARRVRS